MGQIAQRANGGIPPEPTDNVTQALDMVRATVADALPKHIGGDRFMRIMSAMLRGNDKLRHCLTTGKGRDSLLGAIVTAAQLGLEPGPLGHAYLIPYSGEVQFQLGYRGCIELARRSGHIKTIYADAVHEGDDFEMSRGVGGTLTHGINIRKERGDVLGYYAFAELKGKAYQYVFMTVAEVKRRRDQYSQGSSRKTSPWATEFDEMAKKTLLKALFKVLPISIEQAGALASDGAVASFAAATNTTVVDVTPPPRQDEESILHFVSEITELREELIGVHKAVPADLVAACGTPLSDVALRQIDLERLAQVAEVLGELLTAARDS